MHDALFGQSLHSPGEFVRRTVRPAGTRGHGESGGPQRNVSADDARNRPSDQQQTANQGLVVLPWWLSEGAMKNSSVTPVILVASREKWKRH